MAELAIVLPILVLVLFSAIDLGRAFHTYVGLTNASREAARYAAVNNVAGSSTQVNQELNPPGGGTFAGCVSGSLTYSGSGGGRGSVYTVTVSCKFQIVTPFLGAVIGADGNNRITITSTASFVVD